MKSQQIQQELRSAEERVSGIKRMADREALPDAKYVLGLFRRFLLQDWKQEKQPRTSGKGYPSQRVVQFDEKPKRAAIRVAAEPLYRAYEDQLLMIYGAEHALETTEYKMAEERCAEFLIKFQDSLDKHPFVEYPLVNEAKDACDTLFPVKTCAFCLGVHRTTIYKWLKDGLDREVHHGYPAVQTYATSERSPIYYINVFAALEWKLIHHKPGKRRENPGKKKAKTTKAA